MDKIKVVHYINQFFAGIGGEDKADYKPEIRNELVGPASAFNSMPVSYTHLTLPTTF